MLLQHGVFCRQCLWTKKGCLNIIKNHFVFYGNFSILSIFEALCIYIVISSIIIRRTKFHFLFIAEKENSNKITCVFFLHLQVSWIRKRDLHILTAGVLTYTSDERFQVIYFIQYSLIAPDKTFKSELF